MSGEPHRQDCHRHERRTVRFLRDRSERTKHEDFAGLISAARRTSKPGRITVHMRMSLQIAALLGALSIGPPITSAQMSANKPGDGANVARAKTVRAYGNLPLSFEANQGQTDSRVAFVSHVSGYTLFLSPSEAVLALRGAQSQGGGVLRMRMAGASPKATASGVDAVAGTSNYILGNDPKQWHCNIPNYSRVKVAGLYRGIDLVYYGNQRQLEYDFVVAPGAEPRLIHLDLSGEDAARLDANGDLVLRTQAGETRLRRPVLYQQDASGVRDKVEGRYTLRRRHMVSIQVAAYDRSRPLIIDPVLSYGSYLGGSGDELSGPSTATNTYMGAIAVDSAGSAYVTGVTDSTDFPTVGPEQPANGGDNDAYITKFTPDGSAFVYSTYLGGSGQDSGTGIAVDASGAAYITGVTLSNNFPTTMGALQASQLIETSAFVTKLSPSGNALVYSTYLSGAPVAPPNGGSYGTSIAVDSSGDAYVTGEVNGLNFPTTPGAFQATDPKGSGRLFEDGFVTKFAPDGASLVYSTYLAGTNNNDFGTGIAIDSARAAYITGGAGSTDFPTVNPAQATLGGELDGFVAKPESPPVARWSIQLYLGGTSNDQGNGIAVDPSGNAYVTGLTQSTDFPTVEPFQPAAAESTNAFVTKYGPGGSLIYSTYLGGGSQFGGQEGTAIAADAAGDAYVTGYTFSDSFPVVNPIQPYTGDGADQVFVTEFNPFGSALIYTSTCLGGSDGDIGMGIAVDSAGSAYVTGGTGSTNFPVTPGAAQTTFGGSSDAFVVKIYPLLLTPTTLAFGNQPVGTTSEPLTATLTNSGLTALTISGITIVGANPTDFSESDNCDGSVAAGSSCTISVTFTPASVASFTATVNVADSASSQPQTITLTGAGINGTAAPQAVLTPTNVAFGNQTVSTTSAAQVVMLSNPGNATLTIVGVSLEGANPADFAQTNSCGSSLAAGASCAISVTFTPASAASFNAVITVEDNAAGPPQMAALSGTGVAPAPQAVLAPTSLAFPNQTAGTTSAAQTLTLSNPGSATLTITGISLAGMNPGDFAQTNTCGSSLAAAASCTISVTFTPASAASFSATISVADNAAGSPQTAAVSGTGVAPAAPEAVLSPTSLTFANQTTGTTSPAQTVTLSNPGIAPLTITGISLTGTNPSDFAQTNTCGSSLAAAASCTISVTFTPASAASFSAAISVADNAAGSPQTSALSATGVSPPAAADFGVSSSTPPQTVQPGASAQYIIAVASASAETPFTSAVTLTASGLPPGATASFNPASVTPGASGGNSTLTVQTGGIAASRTPNSASPPGTRATHWYLTTASVAFLCIGFIRRRKGWPSRMAVLLMVAFGTLCALGINGCGGGFALPRTSTGATYTITVTGTSGADQHSTTVTLTVE